MIAAASMLAMITATVLLYAWLLGFGEGAFAAAMYTAVAAILLGVWAWRRWSYGVFLDAGSVRITYVSGTVLFPLGDIVRLDVRPHRTGPLPQPANCLWIVTHDGMAVATPLVRGRPRLGAYLDERPAGLYLHEPEFDAVVAEIATAAALKTAIGGRTARR